MTDYDYDRLVSTRPSESKRTRRERSRTIAIVVISVLLAVFAVLNHDNVQVDFILGSGHAPLIIVIVLSVLAGAALTWLGERAARRRGRGPGA